MSSLEKKVLKYLCFQINYMYDFIFSQHTFIVDEH
jgi:hypothetical protein